MGETRKNNTTEETNLKLEIRPVLVIRFRDGTVLYSNNKIRTDNRPVNSR